ncbi:MAG: AbrB/MazE/SpoVT family DNA-binding domain-containing protein [Candidatus Kerfeldbacteria bacterium]|nr:AbrB/MazE/SpoVT family DNA-binding domain-containing protein [Candidatus Kerfeldbacteria bacterium]
MSNNKKTRKRKPASSFHDFECFSATHMGERGQVVIPAEVREHLGLRPGEKLFTFVRMGEFIILVRTKVFHQLFKQMNRYFGGGKNSRRKLSLMLN